MIKYIKLDSIKYVAAVLVLAFVLSFGSLSSAPSALADKPLDVDCEILGNTILAVDEFLDGEGVQFDSVGDLLSTAILDDAVFGQLSGLILLFSGGAIDFDSASQTVSTIAGCGLMPLLNTNIQD